MNHNDAIRLFAQDLAEPRAVMDKATAHAKAQILRGRRARPKSPPGHRPVPVRSPRCSPPATRPSSRRLPCGASGAAPPGHGSRHRRATAAVQKCLSFLDTVQANDLRRSRERKCPHLGSTGSGLRGRRLPRARRGAELLLSSRRWRTAILRHNGVDLGKMDYIGSIPTKKPEAGQLFADRFGRGSILAPRTS